jgi:hypothetical protein
MLHKAWIVIVFYYFLKGDYATFVLNITNSGFENNIPLQ